MRGRSQPVATPVLDPDGFRPIGSLTVGDLVIGSDGKATPVLGVYPQGEKDISGSPPRTALRRWPPGIASGPSATRDDRRRGKPLRVLTTRDMIGNLHANHYHRYELPLNSGPVCFPHREMPKESPMRSGLLLGDGCLTGIDHAQSFATGDPELAYELKRRLQGNKVRPWPTATTC